MNSDATARALGFRNAADMIDSAVMLRTLVDAVERNAEPFGNRRGNAPGHGHDVPGVYNKSNGLLLGGTRCEWCALWRRAKRLAMRRKLKKGKR